MIGQNVRSGMAVAVAISLVLFVSSTTQALGFNRQLSIEDQTLYLNGQGPRKKTFLTVYDVALYLTEKGSDAQAIIDADHPMAVSLVVRSRFATSERISEAFREGLENSTGGNTEPIETQSEAFLGVFDAGVDKDDEFEFVHVPEQGVRVYKNGVTQKLIRGLEFKQALFGIWLSDTPVSNKLRAQLLGQR